MKLRWDDQDSALKGYLKGMTEGWDIIKRTEISC